MNLISQQVTKIVQAKPRTYILIQNLTNSSVYISNREMEIEDYTNNSVVLRENGLLEINPCVYQGSYYAVTDIDSDIRVLEQ